MSANLLIVVLFLGLSLLFYLIFAGADFGGGILDLFLRGKKKVEEREIIAHAMAPVWEANHVWLILAVVILFMAFPHVYTLITTYLHLPLMAVLVGIVARGCAFTFRHYDPASHTLHAVYSKIFALASVWTTLFLGILMGGIILGRINPTGTTYHELFIAPWLNPFCLSVGCFFLALFSFLAAVFLIGEAKDRELQRAFRQKSEITLTFVVLLGSGVFLAAERSGFPLASKFITSKVGVFSIVTAVVLLLPFWLALRRDGSTLAVRSLGVVLVTLILLGCYGALFPTLIRILDQGRPTEILILDAAAPEATLKALRNALLFGSIFIMPALAYLFKVFKWETLDREL